MEGFRAQEPRLGPDIVVVGNVCRRDHVEVLATRPSAAFAWSFPGIGRALARQRQPGRRRHAWQDDDHVALAWVLKHAGRDPSYMIGGVPLNQEMGTSAALGQAPLSSKATNTTRRFSTKKQVSPLQAPARHSHLRGARSRRYLQAASKRSTELPRVHRPDSRQRSAHRKRRLKAGTGGRSVGAVPVERYGLSPARSGGRVAGRGHQHRPGGRTVFEVLHRGRRLGSFGDRGPALQSGELAGGDCRPGGSDCRAHCRGDRPRGAPLRRRAPPSELRGIAQGRIRSRFSPTTRPRCVRPCAVCAAAAPDACFAPSSRALPQAAPASSDRVRRGLHGRR